MGVKGQSKAGPNPSRANNLSLDVQHLGYGLVASCNFQQGWADPAICLMVYSLRRVASFRTVLCNASSILDVHSPGFSDMEAPSQLRESLPTPPSRELPAHIIWPL